jgi:hypothetical protein
VESNTKLLRFLQAEDATLPLSWGGGVILIHINGERVEITDHGSASTLIGRSGMKPHRNNR